MDSVESLLDLIAAKGVGWYGQERVTQAAHALQCARLAEQDGSAPALIAAALLHDLGHLLARERPAHGAVRQHDDRHEHIAAGYLTRLFGPAVTEPVRLHVDAKRWLCGTDPGYHATLSPGSVRSLELQGGPFAAAEAAVFFAQPYAADAIKLRRWDDLAKDPSVHTTELGSYGELLRGLAH
jgi:[1-hydroxy-2-(trimethylamino)ethyl]phosphonate dioxygenase